MGKEVRIQQAESRGEIYCRYRDQINAQPVHVQLDIRDGVMWASYNPEIGNAMPMDVWHGLIRRYMLYSFPTVNGVNEFMEHIKPYAQRVLDDSREAWNDHDWIGKLGNDAKRAEEGILSACENWFEEGDLLRICDVEQWFEACSDDDLSIEPHMTDEQIDTLASVLEDDAINSGEIDILEGDIQGYIRRRMERYEEDELA